MIDYREEMRTFGELRGRDGRDKQPGAVLQPFSPDAGFSNCHSENVQRFEAGVNVNKLSTKA